MIMAWHPDGDIGRVEVEIGDSVIQNADAEDLVSLRSGIRWVRWCTGVRSVWSR
jgi:hypothetical protein